MEAVSNLRYFATSREEKQNATSNSPYFRCQGIVLMAQHLNSKARREILGLYHTLWSCPAAKLRAFSSLLTDVTKYM